MVTIDCSQHVGTEAHSVKLDDCRSMYQRTKVQAEEAVWELIREGMPITIVNPSTPIGSCDRRPTPTGRLIVDFLSGRLPAYLDTLLNWVSVEDVANGLLLAGQCDAAIGQTINIASGQEISLRSLAHKIAAICGWHEPVLEINESPFGLIGRCWADIGRARNLLNYQPSTPLERGLELLLQWLQREDNVMSPAESAEDSAPRAGFIPIARPLLGRAESAAPARRPAVAR